MFHYSRKQFLKQSLMAAAALPFAPLLARTKAEELAVPIAHDLTTDEAFWATVRQQFLIDEHVVNLNNGAVGPQPLLVQQSHIRLNEKSNRAPSYYMWNEVDGKREELRTQLAELVDADVEEVAIDRNTTEGLNTIIFGLPLKKGDEVVVSDFDYPFMLNAWNQRVQRDGIVLKTVKLPLPLEDDDKAVELYSAAITERTKVVHLTHLISWTGQIMPVAQITRMAQLRGCEVLVDAAHSLAHIPLSFKHIGCDYMATSLHKWLGGPFGTGALMMKKEKIAGIWPLLSAWEPQSDDIRKFELLGTRSYPAEMAVLDAIAFHKKIGLQQVNERLHHLKTYWTQQVKDIKGLTFHTSVRPQFSAGMATFSIASKTGKQVTDILFEEDGIHVGIIRWNGLDAVRISPHIFTSLSDLDRLVAAIHKLSLQ